MVAQSNSVNAALLKREAYLVRADEWDVHSDYGRQDVSRISSSGITRPGAAPLFWDLLRRGLPTSLGSWPRGSSSGLSRSRRARIEPRLFDCKPSPSSRCLR